MNTTIRRFVRMFIWVLLLIVPMGILAYHNTTIRNQFLVYYRDKVIEWVK